MAAGATYVSIASQTLSSNTSSVTFSSIPSTYTDLVLIISANGGWGLNFRLNGDTASNYSLTELAGAGTTSYSSRTSGYTNGYFTYNIGVPANANTYGTAVVNFMNYANTTTNKSILSRFANAGDNGPGTECFVNLWRSNSAITSIAISTYYVSGNYYASGSTFSLYGIAAA